MGDASNARMFVQADPEKSLVMRRVGWTSRAQLGTIGRSVGRFDRLGEAPYR